MVACVRTRAAVLQRTMEGPQRQLSPELKQAAKELEAKEKAIAARVKQLLTAGGYTGAVERLAGQWVARLCLPIFQSGVWTSLFSRCRNSFVTKSDIFRST